MRHKSAAFLCLLYLVPCTDAGSVLPLWGGLARRDGGRIVSCRSFTVRFATSSASPSLFHSLSVPPLNVLLHSKASKSLLTGKLWTHRELIRVNARLLICMWISCGCIPGLFMSFTRCLGLPSFETSHCRRCVLRENTCVCVYRKSASNAPRTAQSGLSELYGFFKDHKCARGGFQSETWNFLTVRCCNYRVEFHKRRLIFFS